MLAKIILLFSNRPPIAVIFGVHISLISVSFKCLEAKIAVLLLFDLSPGKTSYPLGQHASSFFPLRSYTLLLL